MLVPALDNDAEQANRDPTEIRRTKQLLLSYDEEHNHALESTGFWRGPPVVGFDQEIHDPREIEDAGQELSFEEMTDEFFLTDDPAEVSAKLDELKAASFNEIEILSSSPDQEAFIEMMEQEILDNCGGGSQTSKIVEV